MKLLANVITLDGRRLCFVSGVWLIVFCMFIQQPVYGSGFGRCPKYPSMPKFNLTKFLGKWYELERSFYFAEIAASCTTLTFHEDSSYDDNHIEISVRSINQWTGSPSVNNGFATPENDRSSIMDFQFETRLPSVIARYLPGSGKYQVLFTDYDHYTIMWSCSSLGAIGHTDQMWLLSRERRDFDVDARTTIHETLTQLGLDPDRLMLSKNKNCTKQNDEIEIHQRR